MKRDAAFAAANSWFEIAGQASEYGLLSSCLVRWLPEDTDVAAAVFIQDQAAVVALAGNGFFVVTLERSIETKVRPVVERFPLDFPAVALRIRDDLEGSLPSDLNSSQDAGVRAHVREWVLTFPGLREVTFSSVLRIAGRFQDSPSAGEQFGRALAERIGWTLPD